jgi:hypothetical protein
MHPEVRLGETSAQISHKESIFL